MLVHRLAGCLVVAASILSVSGIARADVAPDPCENLTAGAACETPAGKAGTCQDGGGFLTCVESTGTGGGGGSGGSGGSGGDGGSTDQTDGGSSDDGCSAASSSKNAAGGLLMVAGAAIALAVATQRRAARKQGQRV